REGKTVYLILPMPAGEVFEPQSMFRRAPFAIDIKTSNGFAKDKLLEETNSVRTRLMKIAQETGAIAIDPFASLCPSNVCPAIDSSGEAMYRDKNHLSPFFVRKSIDYLDPTLKPERGEGS